MKLSIPRLLSIFLRMTLFLTTLLAVRNGSADVATTLIIPISGHIPTVQENRAAYDPALIKQGKRDDVFSTGDGLQSGHAF